MKAVMGNRGGGTSCILEVGEPDSETPRCLNQVLGLRLVHICALHSLPITGARLLCKEGLRPVAERSLDRPAL